MADTAAPTSPDGVVVVTVGPVVSTVTPRAPDPPDTFPAASTAYSTYEYEPSASAPSVYAPDVP